MNGVFVGFPLVTLREPGNDLPQVAAARESRRRRGWHLEIEHCQQQGCAGRDSETGRRLHRATALGNLAALFDTHVLSEYEAQTTPLKEKAKARRETMGTLKVSSFHFPHYLSAYAETPCIIVSQTR